MQSPPQLAQSTAKVQVTTDTGPEYRTALGSPLSIQVLSHWTWSRPTEQSGIALNSDLTPEPLILSTCGGTASTEPGCHHDVAPADRKLSTSQSLLELVLSVPHGIHISFPLTGTKETVF
jgi:hypothetical protein